MGRARVEGHIAIYESVKVILVVGVALSLSFSSPLPPLASHSFVARRSSRPLSSSPSSSTSIWSSSKPSSSSSSPSPPHSSSSHVARRSSRSSSSSSLSSFIRYRQIDYPQPLLRPPPTPPPLHHHLCCSSPSSSSLHRLGLCAGLLRAPEQLLCHRPRRVTGQYLGGHVRTPSPLPPRGRFL